MHDLRIIFLQTDCKIFDLSLQNIDFSSRTQQEISGKIPEFPRKFPQHSRENSPTPTPSHPYPLTTTQPTPRSYATPTSRTSISIFYINLFHAFPQVLPNTFIYYS